MRALLRQAARKVEMDLLVQHGDGRIVVAERNKLRRLHAGLLR
jgi:hypothetical protein